MKYKGQITGLSINALLKSHIYYIFLQFNTYFRNEYSSEKRLLVSSEKQGQVTYIMFKVFRAKWHLVKPKQTKHRFNHGVETRMGHQWP